MFAVRLKFTIKLDLKFFIYTIKYGLGLRLGFLNWNCIRLNRKLQSLIYIFQLEPNLHFNFKFKLKEEFPKISFHTF